MRSPMRSPRVSARVAARAGRNSAICAGGGLILKIRRDDRGAIVVVARVQDQADRVPNPFCRLHRAQFVQHQNVRFKDGTKNVQLGGLNSGVVRILDFLQQFAIVIEQARDALVEDKFLSDPNRQVSLAGANLADDQQARAIARIVFLCKLGSREMSERQRGMSARKIRGVAGEFAMFVTLRYARRRQQSLTPRPQLAIAARDSAVFGRARGWRGASSIPCPRIADKLPPGSWLTSTLFVRCFSNRPSQLTLVNSII